MISPEVAVLLLLSNIAAASVLLSTPAHSAPAHRTYRFTAAYQGTISVSGDSSLGTRKAKGKATVLGPSTLAAADKNINIPVPGGQVAIVAGEGRGTLSRTAGARGSLHYLYMFAGDPVASGYFLIYGGTGKFMGATDHGTFREVGSASPGQSAPITDSFSGTLSLP